MYAREREGGRGLLSNRQRVKMGLRFAELDPRGLNSSPAFMFCHWRKSASFFLSLFVSLRGKIGHSASFERGTFDWRFYLIIFLSSTKEIPHRFNLSLFYYLLSETAVSKRTNWSGTLVQTQLSKLSCIFNSCTVAHITFPILFHVQLFKGTDIII